jgi:hypothetical protein
MRCDLKLCRIVISIQGVKVSKVVGSVRPRVQKGLKAKGF